MRHVRIRVDLLCELFNRIGLEEVFRINTLFIRANTFALDGFTVENSPLRTSRPIRGMRPFIDLQRCGDEVNRVVLRTVDVAPITLNVRVLVKFLEEGAVRAVHQAAGAVGRAVARQFAGISRQAGRRSFFKEAFADPVDNDGVLPVAKRYAGMLHEREDR